MSYRKVLLGMSALLVVSAFGQDFYALSNSENLAIYENRVREINESAIAVVSTTENLLVTETDNGYYKVETEDGTIGWVESDKVTKTEKSVETFANAQVTGYQGEGTTTFIDDPEAQHSAPIAINRSFKDALLQNANKDEVIRIQ